MTQPPPPPPVNYAAPPPQMSPADEKMWATLTHVGGIVFHWLAPLIAYLVLKDRGPFVRWHTRQALNFQLTLLLAYIAGGVLSLVFIGLFVIAAGVSPAAGRETLDAATRRTETVLLTSRVSDGLPISELDLPGRGAIAGLIADGLIDGRAALHGRVVLTLSGRLLADAVVRRLLG